MSNAPRPFATRPPATRTGDAAPASLDPTPGAPRVVGRQPTDGRGRPDADGAPHDVTALLLELRDGRREALDRIFPIVYAELHRIAHAQLARERDGHTLSTTALVHEAYFKLVDVTRVEWQDRTHFLSMAARAMRRILVDYARQHSRLRRGGGLRPVTLDEALVAADHQADTLLALDLALERLGQLNERLARLVECRFFGGLTEEDTAAVLGVNVRTVRRDWVKARGWLHAELADAAATD